MGLHGLMSVTIGVPNVDETAAYYTDFGLAPDSGGWFSTTDASRQLRIVPASTRRLVELRVGVDDEDDLARAAARLLPAPRGPRGHDDRRPRPPLTRHHRTLASCSRTALTRTAYHRGVDGKSL